MAPEPLTPLRAQVRAPAWDVAMAAFGAALLGFMWLRGVVASLLVVALIAGVLIGAAHRVTLVFRRRLSFGFVRRPLARAHRAALLQCLLGWMFLAVLARVLEVSLVPEQLGEHDAGVRSILCACLLAAAAYGLMPTGPVRLPSNGLRALMTLFFGVQLAMVHGEPGADAVALGAPFAGDALVIQGGLSPLVNHHYLERSQRHAIDLVLVEDGRLRRPGRSGLDAYPCFGTPILAPGDGRVVRASDDLADLAPGDRDSRHLAGNHVVLELGPRRYLLLAHLQAGSVRVAVGDRVVRGQPLAACGNSGNTSEPHLHLQVQDRPELTADTATFPIVFVDVVRTRGGERSTPGPVAVRRNDHLRSAR